MAPRTRAQPRSCSSVKAAATTPGDWALARARLSMVWGPLLSACATARSDAPSRSRAVATERRGARPVPAVAAAASSPKIHDHLIEADEGSGWRLSQQREVAGHGWVHRSTGRHQEDATLLEGMARRDEGTAAGWSLDHDGGACQGTDDAVAARKGPLRGPNTRGQLRDDGTASADGPSQAAMGCWVGVIETTADHGDGRTASVEGSSMGGSIDPDGQAGDHAGVCLRETRCDPRREVSRQTRRAACPHHGHVPAALEICWASPARRRPQGVPPAHAGWLDNPHRVVSAPNLRVPSCAAA